ncbi:MAG: hypothetical protein U1F83_01060 [Verrucomicrobiota bacterium]
MKTRVLLIATILLTAWASSAQVAVPTPTVDKETFSIAERGRDQRVWERFETQPAPDGSELRRRHTYTELETGMHYRENGQWNETKEEIEILADHAVAVQGGHKVIFAPDISDAEVIHLETPEGKQLRSRIFGLSYFDSSSGKAVLIAEVKSSAGQLLPPNHVIYGDAFDDVRADVEYIYTKAGFEQNIVLRAQLPLPGEFGLNPLTTRLQVLTEFLDPPVPARSQDVRATGLADEFLDFGEMKMGRGFGFSVGDVVESQRVPVVKHWTTSEGRTFLVEEIPVLEVDNQINTLMSRPRGASLNLQRQGKGENVIAALKSILPRRTAQSPVKKIRMAKLDRYQPKGFVLDYTITLSSATNFTFKSDTTHYVSGTVNLSGTTTFEGGAIVKYAVANNATVVASNTVWQTDSYRPVIFTSKNDNSVGETISGSSGNPTTNFASSIALDLGAQTSPLLSHVKFSYLSNAINASAVTLLNAQLVQCYSVFASTADTFHLRNVLGWKLGTLQKQTCGACTPAVLTAENVTLHYVTNLVSAITNASISLTNCLFAQVTNLQPATIITNHSYILSSDSGVFQTVNGGAHYLAPNSIYRNAGTNNINADLLTWLNKKTTYPPLAFTNTTSTYAALGPQAQRDTDTPDVGYHYDPLDYLFGKVDQNSDLTFAAGTAVGWFRYDQGWTHAGHGIHIADNKTVNFAGLVDAPCWFAHQTAVQESLVGYTPIDAGPGGLTGWATKANRPYLNLRFTKFAGLPIYRNHIRDDSGCLYVTGNHCEFFGGGLGGYVSDLALTNCLLDRVGTWLSSGDTNWNESFSFQNCTVRGGYFVLTRQSANIGRIKVTIRDCAFDDGVDLNTSDSYSSTPSLTYCDYNAFLTNKARTTPTGAHDVIVTNFNWQTGWLGRFYLPTTSTLIDVGSVTAPTVGLYHFTTQTTDNTKETSSQVDIGYHYVGLNSSGGPIDTDGDGTPDYFEDINGNGNVDSGETDWNYPTGLSDLGLRVFITEPKRSANLP